MQLHPLQPEEAMEIGKWRYEGIYAFYNSVESPEALTELLDGSYYAVRADNGELIGFFCLGPNAQVPAGRAEGLYEGLNVIDLGLGMRPALTGQGLGSSFLHVGLQFVREQLKSSTIRLTVACFNERAIRLYSQSGFVEVATFESKGTPFNIMEYQIVRQLISSQSLL